MAFLTTVEGSSSVVEKVFENRYMHIRELQLMGARIATEGNNAEIQGGYGLKGARVLVTGAAGLSAIVLFILKLRRH